MSHEKMTMLLVEDSKFFSQVLKARIEAESLFNIICAENFASATKILAAATSPFFLALLDLNLPDAPEGEIVSFVRSYNIPCIVFTGEFDDNKREDILAKGVVDYVFKESSSSIDYVVALIHRLQKNCTTQVLVVEDSRSARNHMRQLLEMQMFQVVDAEDGVQALERLEENPNIQLVLTDYNMPNMDGFQLIKRIRAKRDKDSLALIGISSHGNNLLAAKFIKNGADDFLNKPFAYEEFLCRVAHTIDNLRNIKLLKDAAIRDYLTGLHNRRYFFDVGRKFFSSGKRGQVRLTLAMMDIDHFKKINDTYGHDAGDMVLKQVSSLINGHFRDSDVVARMGGEEFCILCVNMNPDNLPEIFDQIRHFVADQEITYNEHQIKVTISIGVTSELANDLDETLAVADSMLYRAKNNGRNQVVIYNDDVPDGQVIAHMFSP